MQMSKRTATRAKDPIFLITKCIMKVVNGTIIPTIMSFMRLQREGHDEKRCLVRGIPSNSVTHDVFTN